jgi:hypothetical protein
MESSKDRLQQYIWPVDEPRSNSFHWQQAQYDLRCSELRQKQQELLGKSPAAAAGRATIDNSAKPFFFAWSKTKPENLILGPIYLVNNSCWGSNNSTTFFK